MSILIGQIRCLPRVS